MVVNNEWTKEDNVRRKVEMPNEIFSDLKEWLSTGEIKSNLHQEFAYSYYWLISYLWKYAEYRDFDIKQNNVKQILGYNPKEKRVDYIIKKNGLLDTKKYTQSIRDFPIDWERKGKEDIKFFMYSDIAKEDQVEYYTFPSRTSFVKSPFKSLDEDIFNNRGSFHMLSGNLFKICMSNNNLGCAGFYLLGYLTYLRNVSSYYNQDSVFRCNNQTLAKKINWSERRVIKITNELGNVGLINKWQVRKEKGQANYYELAF